METTLLIKAYRVYTRSPNLLIDDIIQINEEATRIIKLDDDKQPRLWGKKISTQQPKQPQQRYGRKSPRFEYQYYSLLYDLSSGRSRRY